MEGGDHEQRRTPDGKMYNRGVIYRPLSRPSGRINPVATSKRGGGRFKVVAVLVQYQELNFFGLDPRLIAFGPSSQRRRIERELLNKIEVFYTLTNRNR